MYTIDVIIPNYNGAHLINKNLGNVFESVKKYQSTITIVDDGSRREDYEELKKFVHEFEQKYNTSIRLLRSEKNRGFSSTVNKGLMKRKMFNG